VSTDNLEQQLADGLVALSLDTDTAAHTRLLALVQLLAKWNKTYNLTAVRQPRDMVTRHLLDSLAIYPYLRGPRILDVGTGPGLPGIPLALICPEWQFTLLDSNGKKTRFVTQALAELELPNAGVVQSRIEAYHATEHFHTITSRAFTSIAGMVSGSQHLLAEGGRFLLMKGVYPEAELAEMPLGFELEAVHKLTVPGLDAERCVLVINKLSEP